MNDEPQYSRGVVVAAAAWLTTALMIAIAWISWALGDPDNVHFAILTAETACVVASIAAVAHLRCYAARICRLIRTSGEVQRLRDDAEVTRFSPRR